ncbi:MAG TPA: carboxypeptidase regulatory-like domain-containing protein, partial [Vicinamibacterales bacterium]|nr:carboxypeptidase regulatory-like domain-containing protein [Vicinamibacterales bacterium]
MTRLIRLCLIAGALALPAIAHAQERFGTLTGQVTDAQAAAVPGVTVTVTNADNGEVRTYVTDASGRYLAPDLPPGRYTVEFQLTGFQGVKRTDVSVVLGRSFTVDTTLAVRTVAESVQVVAESAPLIDTRSTLIAHNVSAEEFDRMPKTRTFQSVALAAPSVNSGEIEGGLQVNGASGAENAFTVDGVVTNSLINGQSRENTVFEYLQEVQVKTSGISAEYGGALGGVISAVTKSGGNTRHGELHYYGEGSALMAKPVKRLVLEPDQELTAFYTQDGKDGGLQQEVGGSIGGPIIANRLFYFASYSPRFESTTRDYTFTDDTGDISRDITRQQLFGKVTYARPKLSINGSALWTPTKADGTIAAYDGAGANGINTSKDSLAPNLTRGYEINQVNATGSADISLGNNAFLSVRGATFNDRYTTTGIPLVTPYTYGNSTTAVDDLLPADLRGPIGTANTPRAQITDFDTTRRSTFNVDYNHIFTAWGYHTFKAGYGFQRTINDINSYYPGGYVNLFWGSSFTFGGQTGTGTYGYYEVNDLRTSNKAGNNIHSLYAQDQWAIGNHLTLDIGLRAENEKVPTFRPDYLKYA